MTQVYNSNILRKKKIRGKLAQKPFKRLLICKNNFPKRISSSLMFSEDDAEL
uniref:Uncharacterized protein n=1 Tax=Rhizophagus irregularis (strain DAOM 181602 / DAOM 197198 / MUCL 43194) TaxID=747089 RepID=U9U9X7_RHIID